ncbi:MAG: RDD family protein [candidate division NC10 bacterium]|nr:RDD family protein [candidate division NC10 bacterium]
MRCPHCGFTASAHATTCDRCGRALPGTGTDPPEPAPPAVEQAAPFPPPGPASSWWGTALPPEVAAELDPEKLTLNALRLPVTILEGRARAEAEAAAAEDAAALAGRRYGGFWLRGMAALIDAILAGGLAFLAAAGAVVAAAGGGALGGGLNLTTDVVAVTAALLAAAGASLGYHTLFTGAWGQTPGKMFFGLTVARVGGKPLGYGRAAWRWAASWVALVLFGIGLLMIALTPRKQGLHDLLAGTVILRQPPGSS